MNRISVVVLMGGPDAERNISIQSGKAVAKALRASDAFLVEELVIDTPSIEEIQSIECDVIFPVLHGPFGEGGPLQELLEQCGKSFVGSASGPAQHAMDKVATKKTTEALHIPTPKWCLITEENECTINTPLVLKPNADGSSVDVAICHTDIEFQQKRTELLRGRRQLLAEQYIQGRELTVGIVNGVVLPIVEIITPPSSNMYDFEAKYQSDETQYVVSPADLPDNNCCEAALQLYKAMDIRDLARVDFLFDQHAWLLEINTMPGFTNHSLLPLAAEYAGLPMEELCAQLVFSSLSR